MKNILKHFILLLIFQYHIASAEQSIIILYGCSSSGKTSIATELLKILPGNWKYIASNQFRVANGNKLLWKHINDTVAQGLNVIVDTHDAKCIINQPENLQILKILLYCSPEKLIEHVSKRNIDQNNQKNHREVKSVFLEFCGKYKTVSKNEPHIDTLNKNQIKKIYGLFATWTLKTFFNHFFSDGSNIVYITSIFKNYDCLINSGKLSIQQCALKIKDELNQKSCYT